MTEPRSAMRVAVIGAGGTGGYFGGLLARAGLSVSFLARGKHLQAMRERGLTLISPAFGTETVRVTATDDAATIGPVDLVLVCVKTYDLAGVARALASLVGPQTAVLGLQNGIDDTELIAAAGEAAVLSGVAQVVAFLESPGVVRHEAAGKILLGERNGPVSERVQRIAAALAGAGVEVTASAQMLAERWRKLIWIAAQAGLTSLTRRGLGALVASPQGRELFREVIVEVTTVARAAGADLAPDLVEQYLSMARGIAERTPQVTSSMCRDLLAGKRLELDAIHGAILRQAARSRLTVPAILALFVALEPYAAGATDKA